MSDVAASNLDTDDNINFLKHLSEIRVKRSEESLPVDDLKHLLTGYCIFDANRVRYRLIKKKKKIAIIGVVCGVKEGRLKLSSLTRRRLDVVLSDKRKRFRLGDTLLLMDPVLEFLNDAMQFEMKGKANILFLGKAVDFGICSFVDTNGNRCSEAINKSIGHMCETHAQTESKALSKMIARRQELGGALIYNELRFNYHSRHRRLCPALYTRGSGEENTSRNKRKRAFYDEPGFEKKVEDMPAGKEKTHLEALLRRLKPKQVKTMQQQMKEYLAKKQMQCDPGQEDSDSMHSSKTGTDIMMTPPRLLTRRLDPPEDGSIVLESIEPRPSQAEIESLILSMKKAAGCLSGKKPQSQHVTDGEPSFQFCSGEEGDESQDTESD